jgi:proprotein convertase subtilisin/kexin type 5
LACSGFSVCDSCITGYIFYQNQCIVNCPTGKFANTTVVNSVKESRCESCQTPCMYCVETAAKCTFCQSTFYLYNNACYKNCSTLAPFSTFYNEPVTSTCTKCMFPCRTCLSQYECLSCIIGYLNTVEKKCR